MVILGDFNGRIGETELGINRASKDTTINKRGEMILGKVSCLGLEIGNESLPRDTEGNLTFIHRNGLGLSVVDYLLYNDPAVVDFEVGKIGYSDHLPITTWIKHSHQRNDDTNLKITTPKYLCFPSPDHQLDFIVKLFHTVQDTSIFQEDVDSLDNILHENIHAAAVDSDIFKPDSSRKYHFFFLHGLTKNVVKQRRYITSGNLEVRLLRTKISTPHCIKKKASSIIRCVNKKRRHTKRDNWPRYLTILKQ